MKRCSKVSLGHFVEPIQLLGANIEAMQSPNQLQQRRKTWDFDDDVQKFMMMMMMTMVAELECDVMMHCGAGNHQVPVIEGSPEKCTRVLASHQSGDHPPESGQHLQRKQFVPPMVPASPDRRIPQLYNTEEIRRISLSRPQIHSLLTAKPKTCLLKIYFSCNRKWL